MRLPDRPRNALPKPSTRPRWSGKVLARTGIATRSTATVPWPCKKEIINRTLYGITQPQVIIVQSSSHAGPEMNAANSSELRGPNLLKKKPRWMPRFEPQTCMEPASATCSSDSPNLTPNRRE